MSASGRERTMLSGKHPSCRDPFRGYPQADGGAGRTSTARNSQPRAAVLEALEQVSNTTSGCPPRPRVFGINQRRQRVKGQQGRLFLA